MTTMDLVLYAIIGGVVVVGVVGFIIAVKNDDK
jgi:preprotein translocase subunit Sss1